jgi:CheY-like chemotaxis protein
LQGHGVAVATDGQVALDMIAERKPDLVLLDIMMPGLDGFSTCKMIKQNPETCDIPVIFLTAKVDTEDIVKGFELGAADYVTKPFNSSELIARVKTHLELKKNRDIIVAQSCEQKELLHMLCHDLANPFQAIVFVAQMFDTYEDPGKLKNLITRLVKVADKGTDIIELVRKMQALEEGKFVLERCDLKEALYESVFLLAGKFAEKDVRWQLSIKDDAELWVYAENTSLINSVITNILTNAIKFSFPGSEIVIRAWLETDQVFVSIKDCGIGMSGDLLCNVFDIKKSVSRTGTGGEKGTGFGMPLIKKFITAYNGDIQVKSADYDESPDNHGTEVLLKLKPFQ